MSKRKRISLYIASQLVDLDDQSFILFNYTHEDLSNPTIIKNSFTKQIVLKGSPINNKIFGDIFLLDRKTLYGTKYLGAYFDPARRTPFTIYNEMNEIIESGYVKLDKVTKDGVSIEYHITLYGGLGSFFYGLMYNDDGEKRTLGDMDYFDMKGDRVSSFQIPTDSISVSDAWFYLEKKNTNYSIWNIINFAPAYNGFPDKFDAKKALVLNRNVYTNIPLTEIIDDVEYGMKSDASTRLITFSNDHSEWEICDLRWYLQRPVMSIKAFFAAICDKQNNGGFEVSLDESFFNSNNPYYEDAWMTLQMIAAEDRNSTKCLNNILKSSVSPFEIMVSYAKIHGLCFLYDSGKKSVSIMSRKSFYQTDEIIDLTKRINRSPGIEITPLVADSLIYQFGDKVIGQFAEEYKKDYQREYGIQKINTGFEFNSQTSVLTNDIIFKDAVEVMEFNRMFTSGRFNQNNTEEFLLPAYEKVSAQLWGMTGEEGQPKQENATEVTMNATPTNFVFDNLENEYGDWLPKVQLHKNNKPEDGSYVLLFFAGVKETPTYAKASKRKIYWLTNDHPDMTLLNQGTPCWNLTGTEDYVQSLPSFRRNILAEDGKTIKASWEWGVPFARAVPGIEGSSTIYDNWWKRYLQDIYDDDTKKITCKVDLKGLFVNQTLLRRMFWYNNTIWRLNKIVNYSLTTWDDTECEFIKVQDINNYIG